MMTYYLIGGVVTLLSWLVRQRFQSVMKQISRIGTRSGLSGKEIAEKMLADHGIHDVQVISVRGQLTDHYNPGNRTVNLSEAVYAERSVTAAAVAAHEVGHAVQHATKYSFLQFRSAIVPVVSISSRFGPIAIAAGIGLMGAAMQMGYTVFLVGVLLFGASALFSLITLPVEFDASRRALAWMEDTGLSRGEELEQAKKGLRWAAMTYVIAALTQLAYLLYYIYLLMQMQNRRR
ncbi:MAG: zinc metallopeptidase [Bacteroidota bacterium]